MEKNSVRCSFCSEFFPDKQLFLYRFPSYHVVKVRENGDVCDENIGGFEIKLDLDAPGRKAYLCGPKGMAEIDILPSPVEPYRVEIGKGKGSLKVGDVGRNGEDGKRGLLDFLSSYDGGNKLFLSYLECFLLDLSFDMGLANKPRSSSQEKASLMRRTDFAFDKDFSHLYDSAFLPASSKKIYTSQR